MRKLVLAVGLVLMASGAQSATLNVIDGILHGASDVLVDGELYDVQFLPGYYFDCSTSTGCVVHVDQISDFTFQTEASALLASQALLDQVFLDGPSGAFDSDPLLINGCSATNCHVWNPYNVTYTDGSFTFAGATTGFTSNQRWHVDISYGVIPVGPLPPGLNLPPPAFSVWSTVSIPEPSTALLLGLGLTGLAAKGRRRS